MRKTILILGMALLVAGTARADNTLAVNASAALGGTGFGMEVSFDGSTDNAYVVSDHPVGETTYRVSFKAHRNTWNPTNTASFYVLTGRNGEEPALNNSLRFYVRENPAAPGTYHARAIARWDNLTWRQVGCGNFGAVEQTYEIIWKRSTGVNTNDGEITCLRNGVPPPSNSFTALDNDTMYIDAVRFGFFQSAPLNATAAGSYFLDEFQSFRN